MSTAGRQFAFGFEQSFRLPARLFGVTPRTSGITVTDTELRARFGPWRISTPLTNIASITVTGPYRYLKVAGPARLGITDRGLTFATNARRGVQFDLRQPIRGIEPTGTLRHPNLTLTPADITGLVEAASAHF
ncbi:MAG TPA: hypothetical protein VHO01_08405 [Jatrophihabitans sp.]|nr:hypothetical protein [Jatrophihabitans sp.]